MRPPCGPFSPRVPLVLRYSLQGDGMAKLELLVQLKVKVPLELRRRLKVLAAETGKPMNALVVQALTALLKGAK